MMIQKVLSIAVRHTKSIEERCANDGEHTEHNSEDITNKLLHGLSFSTLRIPAESFA